ncbi:MAG: glycoside hydrolase family 3 protein, partial [Alistipes sp.]|nr:glycoside hydrolase family 3 protein [Alistipes sp.]
MKKQFQALILLGLLLVAACTANRNEQPRYLDENAPIEERVEDALSRLTMEEKVALCHAQSKFSIPGVPRLGIPEVWMSDGPHGVRAEIEWDSWSYAGWGNDSCTAFPALTCLAATWNPHMAAIYGKAVGEEARFRKKDVLLGPGLNIYRTPLNGRNFEYMGEDPLLASVMVAPYIREAQKNGIATCVKHYALNNQETARMRVDVKLSERALREIYLPAFHAAVEAGAWSFMGSYNKYLGQHGCHNEVLVNQILKGEWGFDGAFISDWGGAHDTYEAAEYGLDIEMGTGSDGLTYSTKNHYDNYYLALPYLDALKRGEVSDEKLDDKARRVLRLVFRTVMSKDRPWGSFATEEHAAVGREVAGEGIVLLKNDGILPLKPESGKRIAVIGENATRSLLRAGGSSELKPRREVSPLEAVVECYGAENVSYALGYGSGASSYGRVNPSPYDAEALRQEALEVAGEADVVLFVGGLNKSHRQDCEDGDRLDYALPFGQEELIRA